ncbi:hypothetical protein R6Q59_006234 [Mikania micrantha]
MEFHDGGVGRNGRWCFTVPDKIKGGENPIERPTTVRTDRSWLLPEVVIDGGGNYVFLKAVAGGATTTPVRKISFQKGFTQLFGGDSNLLRSDDDNTVHLHLNEHTGAVFRSSDMFKHGLFSARIKLPSDYTAGIVVAFYTSNGDVFEKTHDELDLEFLGNIKGKPWRFQTNFYGNGSTSRGREERCTLWFDPSKDYHRYIILCRDGQTGFKKEPEPGSNRKWVAGDFPSKPMALYATIWDASTWATNGGKYKVYILATNMIRDDVGYALPCQSKLGCLVLPCLALPNHYQISRANLDINSSCRALPTATRSGKLSPRCLAGPSGVKPVFSPINKRFNFTSWTHHLLAPKPLLSILSHSPSTQRTCSLDSPHPWPFLAGFRVPCLH